MSTEHKHAWQMTMHLDGCHWYATHYACECGASASVRDERDFKEDPYSLIWMEDCGEPACLRCAELMDGAEPEHVKEIVEANGGH